MKQLKRSYVRSARLLFALLLVCMIIGSVYDFQISSFLYPGKESSFGQFFAAFGELPAFLALICAGVLLFRHRGCLRRDWNVLFLIGAFGLIFGGIFLSVHEATDNVPAMPAWVPLLVTDLARVDFCMGMYTGIGTALLVIAVLQFIRSWQMLRDDKKLRAAYIRDTDERRREISSRAVYAAGMTMVVALYVALLAAGLFWPEVFWFCYAMVMGFVVLILGFHFYYEHKL